MAPPRAGWQAEGGTGIEVPAGAAGAPAVGGVQMGAPGGQPTGLTHPEDMALNA
jgi:hypothetical protein